MDVATHRHGCCVMQRCLDFANAQQRAALVEHICKHVLQLAQVRICFLWFSFSLAGCMLLHPRWALVR